MPSTPFGSKVILHFTLISLLAESPLAVAIIVATPGPIPVISPFSDTVATFSLLLDHVTALVE